MAFPARVIRNSPVPAATVEAVLGIANAHGVRCMEPAVIADGYNLLIHLQPAPVVAKVVTRRAILRDPPLPWLERELAVSSYLAAHGAPVVPPSDELPPGPHSADGHAVAFFRYVRPEPARTLEPATAGRMLGELHDALERFPGALPVMGAPRNDIEQGIHRLRETNAVRPADLEVLRRTRDRVADLLDQPAGPVRPLHGDAHLCNLMPTRDGFLWHDFEDTCAGPVEWDLAGLTLAATAALAGYPGVPRETKLAAYCTIRVLHGAVCLLAMPPVYTEHDRMARLLLDHLGQAVIR